MSKLKKGIISVSLTLAMTIGIVFMGGLTTFWQTARNTDTKINKTREELSTNISQSRERISALEEAVGTIKRDTKEIKDDIKTLLGR